MIIGSQYQPRLQSNYLSNKSYKNTYLSLSSQIHTLEKQMGIFDSVLLFLEIT